MAIEQVIWKILIQELLKQLTQTNESYKKTPESG